MYHSFPSVTRLSVYSVEQAKILLMKMYIPELAFTFNFGTPTQFDYIRTGMLVGLLIGFIFFKNTMEYTKQITFRAVVFGILFAICLWIIFLPHNESPFLYFNF